MTVQNITVQKGKDGQRSVEAKVEVPGSPEEVWRAIATGDGISSWFVPSKVEEREGGSTVTSFAPGMDAVSKITKWNPPKSYTTEAEGDESEEGLGNVATEWIVEAHAGGTCVVRVVHRWFADTDDWDEQFEQHAYGWAASFFHFLRSYLTHFPGQHSSTFQLSAISQAPVAETWRTIMRTLTVDEKDGRMRSVEGVPRIEGAMVRRDINDPELLRIRDRILTAMEGIDDEDPELLLRLERPAPGLAHLFIVPMGEQTLVSMRFHFFGDGGAAAAADAEREWGAWLAERFPQEAVAE